MPVVRDGVGDRMLHPGIGGEDEIARKPRAEKQHQGRTPLDAEPEPLLAEQQNSEERGFEDEGKQAFHRQRLADHSAGEVRESGPVGAELKFQWNAGDDAEGKAHRKDLRPESGDLQILLIAGPQRPAPQVEQQEGEAHRQLRKEVVECGGEGELKAVIQQRAFHCGLLCIHGAIAGPSGRCIVSCVCLLCGYYTFLSQQECHYSRTYHRFPLFYPIIGA